MLRQVALLLLLLIAGCACLAAAKEPGCSGNCSEKTCPYKNGAALKEQRKENPYRLLALGEHKPELDDGGSLSLSVEWDSVCPGELPAFSLHQMKGGPMNVLLPLRAPESCAEPAKTAVARSARVTAEVPAEALDDPRAVFVAFPPDSDYDIFMVRQEKKQAVGGSGGSPFGMA